MANYWMQANNGDGDVFTTADPSHHPGSKRIAKAEGVRLDREQSRATLRAFFPPGSTAYTVLRHVSASGMSRRIGVLFAEGSRVRDVSHLVARALGDKLSDKGGIVVGWCGMDMGFHLVHNLSSALWGNGYECLGKDADGRRCCPSNYHSNHHDSVRCEGVERGGERLRCYQPNVWNSRHDVPAGWPRVEVLPGRLGQADGGAVAVLAACLFAPADAMTEDGTTREICPACKGHGYLPNPAGPERFDLVHADGYALRHEWV